MHLAGPGGADGAPSRYALGDLALGQALAELERLGDVLKLQQFARELREMRLYLRGGSAKELPPAVHDVDPRFRNLRAPNHGTESLGSCSPLMLMRLPSRCLAQSRAPHINVRVLPTARQSHQPTRRQSDMRCRQTQILTEAECQRPVLRSLGGDGKELGGWRRLTLVSGQPEQGLGDFARDVTRGATAPLQSSSSLRWSS
jgi:hypothetical protein